MKHHSTPRRPARGLLTALLLALLLTALATLPAAAEDRGLLLQRHFRDDILMLHTFTAPALSFSQLTHNPPR